jgi:hypothetical protein
VLLLATLTFAACAPKAHLNFIPEGASYTGDGLSEALDEADQGRLADMATEDAVDARRAVLTDLRREGQDAAALADILTTEFPTDVPAVPFRVERGSYEDADAWVVFEAWGDPGDSLQHKRVWVFSAEDGSLLTAQSAR